MKQNKIIFTLIAILAITFTSCNVLKSDRSEDYLDATKLQEIITQKDFTFEANHVRPMQGRSRALTGDYTLKLSGDTLDVYLPYYGRAYSAPSNPSDGGIKLQTTEFEYTFKQRKNKSFDLTIKPLNIDNSDLRGIVIYINAYEGGSASVNINMTNRQPISFSGTISANKKS